MNNAYKCEACEASITRRMLYVSPYCFCCQGAHNVLVHGDKQGWLINQILMKKFRVTEKEIRQALEFPYWKEALETKKALT